MGLIAVIIYATKEELDGLISFNDLEMIALLSLSILAVSIVINWISTFFAVNKYLNIKTDKLYY